MRRGETRYSLEIEGDKNNYNSAVRFDITDGLLGIDQWSENSTVVDRILLSRMQVAELLAFLRRSKAR